MCAKLSVKWWAYRSQISSAVSRYISPRNGEKMIFYLPIYKEFKDDFDKMYYKDINDEITEIENKINLKLSENMRMQTELEYYKKYGKSWEQNRAVGWIKIELGRGGFNINVAKAHPYRSKIPKKKF
jgi:hypothetical protein